MYLHDADSALSDALWADVRTVVGLLVLCRKYLFTDLEFVVLRHLREDRTVPTQLTALGTEDLRQLARELVFHDVLKVLLGPWCLAGGSAMAAPLAVLLRTGGSLARGVLASRGALALLASQDFLDGEALAGEPLALLAEAGALEALLPIMQIPGVKQEFRHPRFRDASLVDVLEPFPMLFDDLLKAWFKPSEPVDLQEHAPVSAPQLSPSELASWASCERFRSWKIEMTTSVYWGQLPAVHAPSTPRRHGFLDAQLEAAGTAELVDFARQAPLEDPSVARAVRTQLGSLPLAAYQSLPDWPALVTSVLSDRALLRRIWAHRALGPQLLARLVAAASLPALLGPLRIVAAAQRWRSMVWARGPPASPWYFDCVASLRALLACLGHYVLSEMRGLRGASASIGSVAALAVNLWLPDPRGSRQAQGRQQQLPT
mmetsp:Transcript_22567/g.70957  ORF Transcript_22567/g.70957 Transcript_22567/m.70957 type:complete len:431 (+) Transcript_22567:380-1672(+)